MVGPIKVAHATLVDDLADFSKVQAQPGRLEIKTRDCRKAKEDAHRAAGNAGDSLIYRLPASIEGFRVFVFFPGDIADPKFAVSADGTTYRNVTAGKEIYFEGAGDYNYWKPVLYRAENMSGDGKFLKIELTGETQIGRVEIIHALEPK